MKPPGNTLLVISQVYVPDPASLGQHMHDAAREMVRRGYRVRVYTSARGYEDPARRYPRREVRDGVEIRRLPISSFGKRSIALRLIGGILFLAQAVVLSLWTRGLAGILISTSPPMAPAAALFIRRVRRVRVTYWAMDINPDQMTAIGQASEKNLAVRILRVMNRCAVRHSQAVVTLDPFMQERLCRAYGTPYRMAVIPPWPHEDHIEPIDHFDNPFRRTHGLEKKFVVMYSGNISSVHPVTTILEAARELRDVPELLFLFIGGGLGKQSIEQFADRERLPNVRTMPYQPLDQLRYSLSAADVHLVSIGPRMVGIVHPCKVYGAMAAGRPVLLLGPRESHVGHILDRHAIGWQVDHGNVDEAAALLRSIVNLPLKQWLEMGHRAKAAIDQEYSSKRLLNRFCDVLEESVWGDLFDLQDRRSGVPRDLEPIRERRQLARRP